MVIKKTSKEEEKGEDESTFLEETHLFEYYNACKCLLGDKMVEKLTTKIKITEKGTIEVIDDYDLFIVFLEIYRSKQITSPDLIWNASTREELKNILKKEIELSEGDQEQWELNPYQNFEYSIYDNELRVENILIRQLNKDIYFTHKDPDNFLNKLIYKLDELKNDYVLSFELLMATRNCISSQGVTEISEDIYQKLIGLVPNFVKTDIDERESDKLSKSSMLMLEILSNGIKK